MDFRTILTIFRLIMYFPKCCPHRSSNVEESLCMWSWIKTDNITKKSMHALVTHLRGNAWLDFKAQIRLLPQKSNKHVQKFNCNHKQKEDWERKQKKRLGAKYGISNTERCVKYEQKRSNERNRSEKTKNDTTDTRKKSW